MKARAHRHLNEVGDSDDDDDSDAGGTGNTHLHSLHQFSRLLIVRHETFDCILSRTLFGAPTWCRVQGIQLCIGTGVWSRGVINSPWLGHALRAKEI